MKKPILEITVFDDGSTKTRTLDNDFFYETKQIKRYNLYDKYREKWNFSNDKEVHIYLSNIENNISGSSSRISQIVLTVLYMCKLIDEYDNFDLHAFDINDLKNYYTSYNPIDSRDSIDMLKLFLDGQNSNLNRKRSDLEVYIKSYFNQSIKGVSEYLEINTTAIRDKFDRQLGLKIDKLIHLLISFIIYDTMYFKDILYRKGVVSSKSSYDDEAIIYMINEVNFFRDKI